MGYRKRAVEGLYGDTKDMIDKCLSCPKPECNNCIGQRKSTTIDVDIDTLSENEKKYEHVLNDSERRLIFYYATCKSDRHMAETLGFSSQTVQTMRRRLHLPAPTMVSTDERKEIIKLWQRPKVVADEVRT